MKLFIFAIALFWLSPALAEDPYDPSQSNSDSIEDRRQELDPEYRFRWLDPSQDIYVLQNRKYQKKGKALISLMGGVGSSHAYRKNFAIDPRVSYYVSETFGIEAFYTIITNSNNSTYDALINTGTSVIPVIREIKSQYGLLAQWAPWYAKINVFNTILHFDWYFSFGLGMLSSDLDTNTTAGNPPSFVRETDFGFFLGTGHQYHLSEQFIVRIDFTGAFYQAPIFGNSGENTWFSNFTFNVGFGVRL